MNMIETARTRIAPIGEADAGPLRSYYLRNAAHLEPWEPRRPAGYHDAAEWQARVQAQVAEAQEGRAYRFVARLRGADEVLAVVNCTGVARGPFPACLLGYSIDAAQEGAGLMQEVLEAVIPWLFNEAGLHRIMANHLPENTRSAALLARLGFEVEGRARDYLKINGRWRDHVLTACINDALMP
ncbi:GNAT family N-acetyltransferase [Alloyangia mangrovi]|uniref:30S ribosomal protein S5 alanine N-acetyltransferase n=2 Tax=Alloyangia mangrovi TaxID=1779329 RepID=A0A2A3JYE5_9RHOB|nr:GNAT family N-acetyltransferase [Alloyangia mangrovi]